MANIGLIILGVWTLIGGKALILWNLSAFVDLFQYGIVSEDVNLFQFGLVFVIIPIGILLIWKGNKKESKISKPLLE